MPLEKRCIKEGCPNQPLYGVGSLRKGTLRFACSDHSDLLERKGSDEDKPPRGMTGDLFSTRKPE